MEEEGGGGPRLSKRFSDKVGGGAVGTGEVDYKTKSGTAWSHNYLNQKPWHPLSYPNQRRKWIAEQTHAQRERRAEEVAREFAQEQEFFRQSALVSKKEKEKMEMMKAVSFMYVRPPGYNAESAKAAEIADEKKFSEQSAAAAPHPTTATLPMPESRGSTTEDKKKTKPKDVFGRALPTEEEFEVLKNAPRLETGAPARVKPFAVEIRNVRCVRCGTYGHQSGDRECPLKDAIMPSDESRLKRDDPLTAITAQTDASEPLKWELKQRPGISPPRGGFRPDDPNQQIVAEDIFDEYGGFLSGGDIPSLLTNFKEKKTKKHSGKKSKHKRHSSSSAQKYKVHDDIYLSASSDTDVEKGRRSKHKHRGQHNQHSDTSESSDYDRHHDSRRQNESKSMDRQHESKRPSPSSDCDGSNKRKTSKRKHYERHSESERLPSSSDFDSSNKRRMSKSKENEKLHVSGRLAPSSDSDSGYDRRISKSRYKKGRQQHDSKQLSVYSDSDGGSLRKISKRKHYLHRNDRLDSSWRDTCDESDSDHHRRRRKHHHH